MKLNLAFCSLFLVLIFSCKKDNTSGAGIYGKWRLTETLADPGNGLGEWMKVSASSNDYVEFRPDGKVKSTLFAEYATYVLTDSTTITFSKENKTVQHYRYSIKDGVLTMSPNGPIYCIERCGSRFKKAE